MSKRKIELGDQVQDVISGVCGIVVQKSTRIFSDTKYTVVQDHLSSNSSEVKEHIIEGKRLVVLRPDALRKIYEAGRAQGIFDGGTF